MSDTAYDRFTYEVLTHKLRQITEEMGATLKRVSASPIVSEFGDFCTAICDRDGNLVAMGTYITANAFAIRTTIKHIAKTKVNEIYDGDMFIVNDPWTGSLHQSDVIIVAPIFYREELFCWAGSMAHQVDIGASRPGGFVASTEVYQEGLRLPPMKIVEKGKLNDDLFQMILNMVRVQSVGLDLKGQIATCFVCKESIAELCNHYGSDVLEYVMRKGIALSEAKLLQKLRELPDGVFKETEFIEQDGFEKKLCKVVLSLSKINDKLLFDFSGTSEQCQGFMNCTLSGTWGGVICAVFPWLCYDIPWNEGVFHPLEILVPEGSMINARIPAAVSFSTTGPLEAVRNLSILCLSKMMASSEKYKEDASAVWAGAQPKVIFGGSNQFGERYVCNVMDNSAGGGGARAIFDGIDSGSTASSSTPSVANIETYELDYPILFIFRRQTIDSGGCGKFRGGAGCEEAFIPYGVDHLQLTFIGRGIDIPNSSGIFGGYPASRNQGVLIKQCKLYEKMRSGIIPVSTDQFGGIKEIMSPRSDRLNVSRDDAFFFKWNGGGGYGDPLEREPSMVVDDVRNGMVSKLSAAKSYGVVVNENELSYDLSLTKKLRNRLYFIRARKRKERVTSKNGAAPKNLRPRGYYHIMDMEKKVIRCKKCGHIFSHLDQNPKLKSLIVEKSLKNCKWPNGEQVVQREYFCPRCFVLFSVDLELKGSQPLFDIELNIESLGKSNPVR